MEEWLLPTLCGSLLWLWSLAGLKRSRPTGRSGGRWQKSEVGVALGDRASLSTTDADTSPRDASSLSMWDASEAEPMANRWAEPMIQPQRPFLSSMELRQRVYRRNAVLLAEMAVVVALAAYGWFVTALVLVTAIVAHHTFLEMAMVEHIERLRQAEEWQLSELERSSFPVMERTHWLNVTFRKLWPFLKVYLGNTMKRVVNDILQRQREHLHIPGLGKLRLGMWNFGLKAPQVTSVRIHSENKELIKMDFHFNWVTEDADIQFKAGTMTLGLTDVQIKGILRATLGPLAKRWPIVSRVSFSFLTKPELCFAVRAGKVDLPPMATNWLSHFLNEELLRRYFVAPAEVSMPLTHMLEEEIRRRPEGTLLVKLFKVRCWDGSWTMFKSGSNALEVTLRVGSQTSARELRAISLGESSLIEADSSLSLGVALRKSVRDSLFLGGRQFGTMHGLSCGPVYRPARRNFNFSVQAKATEGLTVTVKGGGGIPLGFLSLDLDQLVPREEKQFLSTPLFGGDPLKHPPTVDFSILYRPLKPSRAEHESSDSDGNASDGEGGVLFIALRRAEDLPAAGGAEALADPYFVFQWDDDVESHDALRSSVQKNTVCPWWRPAETFTLVSEKGVSCLALRVNCYHNPNLFEDLLLATCRIRVPRERSSGPFHLEPSIESMTHSPLSSVSMTPSPRVYLDLEWRPY